MDPQKLDAWITREDPDIEDDGEDEYPEPETEESDEHWNERRENENGTENEG